MPYTIELYANPKHLLPAITLDGSEDVNLPLAKLIGYRIARQYGYRAYEIIMYDKEPAVALLPAGKGKAET